MSKRRNRKPNLSASSPSSSQIPLPANANLPTSQIHHTIHAQAISFNGPLPPPEILIGYDECVPGAAKRLIVMAERQSKHRQALEKRVIESDIRRSWMGLAAGFTIAMTCIILGFVLILQGHDTAGATLATASVVGLVSVFVYGTHARAKEREEKQGKQTPSATNKRKK